MIGKLFIVSTHIGNIEDLTFRARRILTECDLVICEEVKPARQLLKSLNLFKELITLNEHNEKENASVIIEQLKLGKNVCLISDAGTPIFSDPGNFLLKLVKYNKIPFSIIPGPDSLIPALILSGFDISKFYFAGWLSPKSEERKKQLSKLKSINTTIALMETPYRLKQILSDIHDIFGENTEISVACDLTSCKENIFRGNVKEIIEIIKNLERKFEFVLIINNGKKGVN